MKHGMFDATEFVFKEWYIKKKIDIVEDVRTVVHFVNKELDRTFTLASNFKKKQRYSRIYQNLTSVPLGPESHPHPDACEVFPQIRHTILLAHLGEKLDGL